MTQSNKRPSTQTMASDNTKHNDANSKQLTGIRKDINEVIMLLRKLCDHFIGSNGGRL